MGVNPSVTLKIFEAANITSPILVFAVHQSFTTTDVLFIPIISVLFRGQKEDEAILFRKEDKATKSSVQAKTTPTVHEWIYYIRRQG